MKSYPNIADVVRKHYCKVQAIYLFGSFDTEQEWPNSDADIALLLPAEEAKQVGSLQASALHDDLEVLLNRNVDLINLRRVPTVLQKEIIAADRRIFCADPYAADEFEMLVMSFYQKLNEERAEVLAAGLGEGRFYDV